MRLQSDSTFPLSWRAASIPLLLLQAVLLRKLLLLCWGCVSGVLVAVHRTQWAVWALYFLAWAVSVRASCITLSKTPATPAAMLKCWLLCSSLVLPGVLCSLSLEGRRLALSKGFYSPLPLIRNDIGTFEPGPHRSQEWSLVGTVLVTHARQRECAMWKGEGPLREPASNFSELRDGVTQENVNLR